MPDLTPEGARFLLVQLVQLTVTCYRREGEYDKAVEGEDLLHQYSTLGPDATFSPYRPENAYDL